MALFGVVRPAAPEARGTEGRLLAWLGCRACSAPPPAALLGIFVVALLVINAVYLFEDTSHTH